jgi:acetylornithine deacetylase/succinyl-diaminopimelate desuccinylase-like protein
MGLAEELQDETAEVLSTLIRFKTVNPPGAERECQEWLAAYLEDAGLTVELDGAEPDRPNLVAQLRKGEGPALGYLSHVDTVLADAEDWSADPWSGEIRDGLLYGRGAIDMKNQTAAEVVAAKHLARNGSFNGTLKIISVADEETGGVLGAKWLTEERPDLSRVDFLLNEGAGAVMPYGDRRLYGVCVAEKGTFRFNVRTAGKAAHASVPGLASNALLKLAPIITALGEGRPSFDLTEATRALLEALGEDPSDPAAALERVRGVSADLAPLLDAAMSVTFAPTIVSAGEKINVIPARAQVRVDCRVPPEMGEDVALKRAREVLGENGYELEFTEAVVGNRSPVESKLMDAIAGWVGEHDPGAEAVPTVLPAFTDSRWFRAAFPECVAYGFFPQRHQSVYETWPLMHAADERIDVRDLGFAAAFFHDLPGRLLAGS